MYKSDILDWAEVRGEGMDPERAFAIANREWRSASNYLEDARLRLWMVVWGMSAAPTPVSRFSIRRCREGNVMGAQPEYRFELKSWIKAVWLGVRTKTIEIPA